MPNARRASSLSSVQNAYTASAVPKGITTRLGTAKRQRGRSTDWTPAHERPTDQNRDRANDGEDCAREEEEPDGGRRRRVTRAVSHGRGGPHRQDAERRASQQTERAGGDMKPAEDVKMDAHEMGSGRAPIFEERRQDAVVERGCVDEVDGELVAADGDLARLSNDRSSVVEIGVKTPGPAGAGPTDFPRWSIGRQPENFKKIVHGCLAPRSADAERHEELSSRVLVEPV